MIVSAVSVMNYQKSKNSNFNKNFVNSTDRKNSDTVIKTSTFSSKKNQADNDEQKIFDAINEWKNFCHQQILNGKLDVIA